MLESAGTRPMRLMRPVLTVLSAMQLIGCGGTRPDQGPPAALPEHTARGSVEAGGVDSNRKERIRPQPNEPDPEQQGPCPPHPEGTEIIRLEEITDVHGNWSKVIALNSPDTVRFAQRLPFWADVNQDGWSDLLLMFGEQKGEAFVPSCESDGLCRQAVYLGCIDGTYVTLLPEQPYGALAVTNESRSWMSFTETVWENGPAGNHRKVRPWFAQKDKYGYSAEPFVIQEEEFAPPTIEHTKYGVDAYRLPAVSADGKQAALVRRFAWYDDSGYADFMVFRTKDGGVLRTIRLWEQAPDGEGEALSDQAVSEATKKANALLERGKFVPMIPLENPYRDGPIEAVAGAGFSVHFDDELPSVLHIGGAGEADLTLPSFPSNGYCCHGGSGPPDSSCELPAYVTGVWADAVRSAVVIQYENYNGPDGCETEREYIVRGFH